MQSIESLHQAFVYPEDRDLARKLSEEKRVTAEELAYFLQVQKADPPPPRSLAEIANTLGLNRRTSPAEGLARFEEKARRTVARDRRITLQGDRWTGQTDYILIRKMGEGGQGSVYFGQQMDPPRMVVVKRLLENQAVDGSAIVRFFDEALLLERINCPGVVELFDYGMTGNEYFIAMEYVAGESLQAYLNRRQRLPYAELLEIAIPLVEILDNVSKAGVVHCDLKPSNLILPVRGARVKLIDFGAAVETGTSQCHVEGWFGSPAYMSPEQFMHRPITVRCDIYSLGIVFHQLLSGKLPFWDRNPMLLGRMHLHHPLPSILIECPDLPVRMVSILRRMTAKKPEERYQTFEELGEELKRVG